MAALLIGLTLAARPTSPALAQDQTAEAGSDTASEAMADEVADDAAEVVEDLTPLLDAAAGLRSRDRDERDAALGLIMATGHSRVADFLTLMLNGELLYRESDGRFVVETEEIDRRTIVIADALTGEDLGQVSSRAVEDVRVNNSVRRRLRGMISQVRLSNPNPAVRRRSALEMINSEDEELIPILRDLAAEEQDPRVREAQELALASQQLRFGETAERLAALETLGEGLNTDVFQMLNQQLTAEQADDDGDPAVAEAIQATLTQIEERRATMRQIETVFFGLSLGSVLLLAAIGLAITFGVMGVINMAHGEMIMLGAYTTFFVQQVIPIEWSLLVAIPAAFVVSGCVGILLERTVIRFLYGRPLETLLATFGVSLILQQAVRTYNPNNVPIITPDWMSGAWEINGALSLTYPRLAILIFGLIVFGLLLALLNYSRTGLKVRAVDQNGRMAGSMGINKSVIDTLTFALGSGIAGIAGVALSQITNVGPNLGQNYIVDSFMVVVFGGVGNLWGTLVSAMTLGVINKIAEPWAGAVLGKVIILVLIILFIQRRPRGLFAPKGRAAEA